MTEPRYRASERAASGRSVPTRTFPGTATGAAVLVAIVVALAGGCELPVAPDTADTRAAGTASGAVIVAVEGLSFANTLSGELASLSGVDPVHIEERDTYLTANLRSLLDASYETESFRWSGDATSDTGVILRDSGDNSLRAYLRERKAYADRVGKPLVVVAHSWGTVLTYLALSLEAAEADPLEVDLYITLSTPLGTRFGHGSTYPEERVISDYVDDWFERLSFVSDGSMRPAAAQFVNYWAWGDLISGPVAGFVPPGIAVSDVRIDEGMFDLPTDSTYSTAAAYSNRNFLDAVYWHKFTTVDSSVLTSAYGDYLSQDFIRDADVMFAAFREDLLRRIRTTAGRSDGPPDGSAGGTAGEVAVTIEKIEVVDEDEGDGLFNPADDYAEYFGYFRLYLDGEKRSIRRMRSENDYLSLEEGDSFNLNWRVTVPLADASRVLKIEAELCEDELGYDDYGYPGFGSVDIDLSHEGLRGLPRSGSFDTTWLDATGGRNSIRVFYRVESM